MIGYFPDPYPDELFYSICARFADRMQYPSRAAVVVELFGCQTAAAIADLPTRLDSVVATLPPGHHYTTDYIIDQHTLLPFFGPFMPLERLNRLRADMRSATNGSGIYRRAGIATGRIPRREWLQFCPQCIKEDRLEIQSVMDLWHPCQLRSKPGREFQLQQ